MKPIRDSETSSRSICVSSSETCAQICANLERDHRRNITSDKLIILRGHVDQAMLMALQRIVAARKMWKVVDFNGALPWSRRLMRTLQQSCQYVDKLVLDQPSELTLRLLGEWLENQRPSQLAPRSRHHVPENSKAKYANLNHIVIRSYPDLTEVSVSALRKGLQSEGSRITQWEIVDTSFKSVMAIQQMAEGLAHQSHLFRISFNSCYVEDSEMALLLRTLVLRKQANAEKAESSTPSFPTVHHPLKELDLSFNLLQGEGMMALSTMLCADSRSNIGLETLNLEGQDIWDNREYYSHLASALSQPSCALRHLNVSSNFMTDSTFMELVEATILRSNSRLQTLECRDNQISNEGIFQLTEVLPQLGLLRLDLRSNRIDPRRVEPLLEALRQQTRIKFLDFYFGSLESPTVDKIEYYLGLNRAGRYCKHVSNLPLGLWPLVLSQAQRALSDENRLSHGLQDADLVYDLLHGPALLER